MWQVEHLAVIFSQGFIHSDDHFDTISVAWDWLHGGLWGEDGNLRWKHEPAETIGRFPLYTLFLLAQMKICHWAGISSLSVMMYFIRLVHALISLLPVWAAFRIVKMSTNSNRWAAIAGLTIAFHFAFPFLLSGGQEVGLALFCRVADRAGLDDTIPNRARGDTGAVTPVVGNEAHHACG